MGAKHIRSPAEILNIDAEAQKLDQPSFNRRLFGRYVFGEPLELAPKAWERIKASRHMVDRKIAAHEIMYGVNTGIGELSEVVLADDQIQLFQRYLIYNHAAGIGKPCPIEHVRAAMLSRINVHARGYSGGRPEITQTYIDLLNKGVTPVVCETHK